MTKNSDNQAGKSRSNGGTENDDQLADLPETSITPEQSSQVKGGLEYPNLVLANRKRPPQLKYETEVTDYRAGG